MYSIWISFSAIAVLFASLDTGLSADYFSELLFMCRYMSYTYLYVVAEYCIVFILLPLLLWKTLNRQELNPVKFKPIKNFLNYKK